MIAVIEDNEEDVELYRRTILSGHNYTHFGSLGEFADGDVEFGVVILDLSLPDAYGFEAVKGVRAVSDGKILVITGAAGDLLSGRAHANLIEAGAFEVFSKGKLFSPKYAKLVEEAIQEAT